MVGDTILEPFWPGKNHPSGTPNHHWALLALSHRQESIRYALDLIVEKVEYCKAKGGFQHEFLIVHLICRPSGRKTCFLTERNQRTPSPASFQPSAASPLLSGAVAADDRVYAPVGGKISGLQSYIQEKYSVIATLKPSEDVLAAQLAILLDIPNEIAPDSLFSRQCYWYAESIYAAIKYLSSGTDEINGRVEEYGKRLRKDRGKLYPWLEPFQKSELDKILDQFNKGWEGLKLNNPQILDWETTSPA